MNEKSRRRQKSSRGLPGSHLMMILSIIIICIVVLVFLMYVGKFSEIFRSTGMKMNPNFTGGYLIAEFEDLTGDLLRKVPAAGIYHGAAKALDINKFSVKKIKFHPLSGMGIAPRLNLVFEFAGKLPNQHNSELKFCLPVIYVYINAPGQSSGKKVSDKIPNISFAGDGWNYRVIIDGKHEQARIFDTGGNLLGTSLDLYVDYEKERVAAAGGRTKNKVKTTRIIAGLPLKILGDPAKGEWAYYVAVGVTDVSNFSLIFPPENEAEPQIFDVVQMAGTQPIKIEPGALLKLSPLIVRN